MSALVSVLCVAVGGALGALVRFALALRFDKNGRPFGTFTANMCASFLLGILMSLSARHGLPEWFDIFAETGFCATLSTFSSLAFQIADMISSRRYAACAVYASATFLFGMVLVLSAYKIFG